MNAKFYAAKAALDFVKNNFVVGLGTGSTANAFIELLGEKATKERLAIECVPTSNATYSIAMKNGLKLVDFNSVGRIDVAVDGADLVDSEWNLLKGMGGALTREKLIDYYAKKFIVIVDESKIAKKLSGIVPMEVLDFAHKKAIKRVEEMGGTARVRFGAGGNFITDNGNLIVDADFKKIENPKKFEKELNEIPGVIENGIFAKKPSAVIVGSEKGARFLKK